MSAALMQERPLEISRATLGDAESFTRLVEPLLDPAYRLAAVMLNDRALAEDAVQEASIKAWRKIRQLRGDASSLRPWLLKIVANECRMSRRGRWWSVLKFADVEPSRRQEPESQSDLHRALLRLERDGRLPLVLHFYLDLPLEEIAKTLGLSTSAAKSRIYRAAKRLRADLTPEDVI